MSNYLKTYSKSVIEVENIKNKILFGGWLSIAVKVFRRDKMRGKNLPDRFEDWILRECGIKKQTMYNYKKLYRLMIIATKLFNCRVNMTYFVKNHDILLNYFQEIEQIPWKHSVNCVFQTCNSYFTDTEHIMTS